MRLWYRSTGAICAYRRRLQRLMEIVSGAGYVIIKREVAGRLPIGLWNVLPARACDYRSTTGWPFCLNCCSAFSASRRATRAVASATEKLRRAIALEDS